MDSVIVSRHKAAVEFIFSERLDLMRSTTPVLTSATVEDVRGKVVFGNLPLHLAAEAAHVVAIEFSGDPPRGAEYGLEEMIQAGAHLVAYKVQRHDDSESCLHCGETIGAGEGTCQECSAAMRREDLWRWEHHE